jgi:hypothetical protein
MPAVESTPKLLLAPGCAYVSFLGTPIFGNTVQQESASCEKAEAA